MFTDAFSSICICVSECERVWALPLPSLVIVYRCKQLHVIVAVAAAVTACITVAFKLQMMLYNKKQQNLHTPIQ